MSEDDLLVPTKYSREAFRAFPFAIMQIIVAYQYKYKRLTILSIILTLTSILHWYKMKRNGWIRNVDIVTAISILASTTFYDSKRFTPFYKNMWNSTVGIGLIGYAINQILYHYQIEAPQDVPISLKRGYWWGSLEYTEPNTADRIHAYRRSVLWHNAFLHILFTLSASTCMIGSRHTKGSLK